MHRPSVILISGFSPFILIVFHTTCPISCTDRLLDDEEEIEGNDATAPDAEYDYSALADACDDSASEGGSGSGETPQSNHGDTARCGPLR